jgi:hypothetical protein
MNDYEFVIRHRIPTCPDYVFEIDEYKRPDGSQFLLAHLKFSFFAPSTLKRALFEWSCFRKCVSAPLYAVVDDGDFKKWKKFVSYFGFEPTDIHLPCNNGVIRQLFISR